LTASIVDNPKISSFLKAKGNSEAAPFLNVVMGSSTTPPMIAAVTSLPLPGFGTNQFAVYD
jgi:hypothetical protein